MQRSWHTDRILFEVRAPVSVKKASLCNAFYLRLLAVLEGLQTPDVTSYLITCICTVILCSAVYFVDLPYNVRKS